jgi:hypothetical protein
LSVKPTTDPTDDRVFKNRRFSNLGGRRAFRYSNLEALEPWAGLRKAK